MNIAYIGSSKQGQLLSCRATLMCLHFLPLDTKHISSYIWLQLLQRHTDIKAKNKTKEKISVSHRCTCVYNLKFLSKLLQELCGNHISNTCHIDVTIDVYPHFTWIRMSKKFTNLHEKLWLVRLNIDHRLIRVVYRYLWQSPRYTHNGSI